MRSVAAPLILCGFSLLSPFFFLVFFPLRVQPALIRNLILALKYSQLSHGKKKKKKKGVEFEVVAQVTVPKIPWNSEGGNVRGHSRIPKYFGIRSWRRSGAPFFT